jgi:membrane-associated phospholipid phosphatase
VADIFLSYKSEDRERAQRIEHALTALGWDVFWDEELRVGDDFRESLEDELARARCVVVLWSTLSVRSKWVRDEASRADKRGKLFAVRIDDVDMPLGFGEMQAADLIGWMGDPLAAGFRELKEGLARRLAPVPALATAPAPAPDLGPTPGPVPIASPAPTLRHTHPALRPTLLLALVFVFNLVETRLDGWLTPAGLGAAAGYPITEAFRGLEESVGLTSFASHDATNALATYGYTFAYFFLLPLVCLHVAVDLARREDPRPYRALSLAVAIDYAISLPFFLLFPVPERWAFFESEAMLLSDKWSDRLIEAIRPMSGLDNSFPSNHVSLTVLVITASLLFAVPLRRCTIPLGATIVLSTFVLGVHWLPDMLAGLGLGIASMLLAWRLTRADRLAFLWGDERPAREDAPAPPFEPAVQQAA